MSPCPLHQGGFSSGLAPKPVQVLYGHDDEVTCVAISTELDMAVSGSKVSRGWVASLIPGKKAPAIAPPSSSSSLGRHHHHPHHLPGPLHEIPAAARGELAARRRHPPGRGARGANRHPDGRGRARLPQGEVTKPGCASPFPQVLLIHHPSPYSLPQDKFALHLYSVNGKHLASVPLDQEVTAMCVTEEFVVLGTMQCGLEIRDLQR